MFRRTTILIFAGFLGFLLALPSSIAIRAAGPKSDWHENVFFGIHNDLHATAFDTELGRELTPEMLRERLLRDPSRLDSNRLQGPSRLHKLAHQGGFHLAREW